MEQKQLFLISGWAHTEKVFDGLVKELGGDFDLKLCTLPALRERFDEMEGEKSTEKESCYSQALRDLAGDRKPIVVGYSMGGMVALEALATDHEVFRKIITVGAAARFSQASDFSIGVPVEKLKHLHEQLDRTPEQVLANFFQSVAVPERLGYVDQLEKVEAAIKIGIEELKAETEFLETFDVRSKIREVPVPLLAIHGRQDTIVKWEAAELLARGVKDGHLVVLHQAGHALLEHQSAEIAREIREFLR